MDGRILETWRGALLPWLIACLLGLLLAGGTAQAATCPGRRLLTCYEKSQAFDDGVSWDNAFVLDLEPFETAIPLHFSNPAIRGFWRFETSTAAARAAYEFELQYEIGDPNFEVIAAPPAPAQPHVSAHGMVSRRMAGKLTSLMRAEQAEAVNLAALVVSLNRATEATYERGRGDWVAWQKAAAARYARRAASAIDLVIGRQHAVTRTFVKHKLLFGVGSEDLKLAHRGMRQHGLNPGVRSTMQSLGMDASLIELSVKKFQSTSYGQASFSLAQLLSQANVIGTEKRFRAALRHFAARTPPASKPPA